VEQEINVMMNFATAGRRFLAGTALAWLASIAPAFADTYDIGLFEGASTIGTGSGQFTFTKTTAGTFPITPTALATNTNSLIAQPSQCSDPPRPGCIYSFTVNSQLNVVVSPVNYNDGKTPPNTITGNYVEGLTGQADTAHENANRFQTCNASGSGQKECFYRIKFVFTPGAPTSNPGTWVRTFTIERWMTVSGVDTFDAVVVSNGRYFVRNTINSAPEPGTLVLVVLALAALTWRRLTLRPISSQFKA
jgi:hypothetical protein